MNMKNRRFDSAEQVSRECREGADKQQYDLSFAYKFAWAHPARHIRDALKLLLCAHTDEGGTQSTFSEDLAKVKWLLAANPHTPPPVLQHLAQNADSSLLERIAENPGCAAETLAQLGLHPSPEVRAAVAENGNTAPEAIARLAEDDCADVRYSLAENHNLPETLLNALSEDENPYVAHRAQTTLRRLNLEAPYEGCFEQSIGANVRWMFGR